MSLKTSTNSNGSSVNTGVHLLDDYIAAHYTGFSGTAKISILKREQ